ncbi:hypothetical protein [Catenulispora sp. GP43]|uniref:hypothetical protein n=1 Tax=Catenulispora sp. GP43 TaxID=3156263 RepID=UPI0035195CAC
MTTSSQKQDLAWLLDSDPAIRWQVLRDLADAPEEQVAAERARVADEGWGARLLALQQADGKWPGGEPAFSSEEAAQWWRSMEPARQGTLFPEWTSIAWSLTLLREFGVEPGHPVVRQAVARVHENARWEHDGEPFFSGEVEPCINGRTVALGAYYGMDMTPVVTRLLGEQMADGGWNCEQEEPLDSAPGSGSSTGGGGRRAGGSTRGSFHTTIEVLEGLTEYDRAAGGGSVPEVAGVAEAVARGQQYMLQRRMMRRLSTGELIEKDRQTGAATTWTQFSHPTYWHYDLLRGLDHLRAAGVAPDQQVTEAVEIVRGKQDPQGRWPLENRHPGELHFPIDDGEGRPSRWNTLRALRVLKWYDAARRQKHWRAPKSHRRAPRPQPSDRISARASPQATRSRTARPSPPPTRAASPPPAPRRP